MRLRQLKDECPKLPEDIRAMIEHEVKVQIQADNEKNAKSSSAGKRFWKKSVAAALVATMALGTTVFAGTKLYQWYTEKEGNYGLKAGFKVTDSEKISIPKEIPVLKFEAKYLPDGMVAADDGSSKYYYTKTPYQGGISISQVAMDEKFSADKLPVSDKYVIFSETLNINGLDAVYLEKQPETGGGISFDKKLYIAYPDYWQILEVFVGEDVSKEEAIKVIQNLEVSPTDKTNRFSDAYTWSEMLGGKTESAESVDKLTASKEEMKNTHQIGEEFIVPLFASGNETDCITAKVTKIQIADDFNLLDEKFIDKDLKDTLGADGNLIKNKISYIKSGDGIDTLDVNSKTEEVSQKLVCVNVEFKNTGNKELKDVLFLSFFIGIEEKENGYTFYDRAKTDKGENTDFVSCSSIGGFGEMNYYDVHGGERNNNYISSIQPGETVTITMAKIVNEDEMDKMYFSLDTSSGGFSFTDSALKIGYVDIRQR